MRHSIHQPLIFVVPAARLSLRGKYKRLHPNFEASLAPMTALFIHRRRIDAVFSAPLELFEVKSLNCLCLKPNPALRQWNAQRIDDCFWYTRGMEANRVPPPSHPVNILDFVLCPEYLLFRWPVWLHQGPIAPVESFHRTLSKHLAESWEIEQLPPINDRKKPYPFFSRRPLRTKRDHDESAF